MDEFDKFYAKAINFLSYRAHSEKEIREYLKKKNTPPEIMEKIISTLIEYKFINDEEFAKMWVESRNRASPRSARVLKMELQQKGITKEVIETVTSTDESISDLEAAKILVRKRLSRFKNTEKEEIYQKLGGFLARRGFNWDTVKHSIDDCLAEEYNT